MNAGRFNRRVTIQEYTDTADGAGGFTRAWADIGKAWVDATPIAGKEGLTSGTLVASQPWRIEMRYRSDLTTEHRFTASWLPTGRALTLQSVADPDGKRSTLVVFGTAVPVGD